MQSLGIVERTPILFDAAETEIPFGIEIRAPKFARFPRRLPEEGLLLSLVLHVSVVVLIPIIFPPLHMVPQFIERTIAFEPLSAPDFLVLPSLGESGSQDGDSAQKAGEPAAGKAAEAAGIRPVAQYAGPQEIISDPPDATNSVQTIRRPDLITPPKMKDPIRLKSMVEIAAPPAVTLPSAPPELLSHPLPSATPMPIELTTTAPPVEKAVLVVKRSEQAPRLTEAAPPEVKIDTKDAAPVLSTPVGTAPTLAKSVVVINAGNVPADANVTIPDAELSGRFSVAPFEPTVRPPQMNGTSNRGAEGSGAGGIEEGAGAARGRGIGSGGTLVGANGAGGTGTSSGTGGAAGSNGSSGGWGSGAGDGARPGNGATGNGGVGNGRNAGLAGISISGGVGGRGGAGGSMPRSNRSYGLMVISAGNNGGPSHDLGVFGRNETVYTVYLPMRDTGGGPDWSMQYALSGAVSTGGQLLPPFPTKKAQAMLPHGNSVEDTSPVFVVGTIDENGSLQGMRVARLGDSRSQVAMAALAQWQFTPATLDGKPVSAKVLIGVVLALNSPGAGQ
jgi:hypothetical protein